MGTIKLPMNLAIYNSSNFSTPLPKRCKPVIPQIFQYTSCKSLINGEAVRLKFGRKYMKLTCLLCGTRETQVIECFAGVDVNTVAIIRLIAQPIFGTLSLLMIVRIIMTWYPQIDGEKFPWSVAYKPTEPFLSITRRLVPALAGIDISPIIVVAILSFFNETVLGP